MKNKIVHIWLETKENKEKFKSYIRGEYDDCYDEGGSFISSDNLKGLSPLYGSYNFAWSSIAIKMINELLAEFNTEIVAQLKYRIYFYEDYVAPYSPGKLPHNQEVIYVGAIPFALDDPEYVLSGKIESARTENEIIEILEDAKIAIDTCIFSKRYSNPEYQGFSLLHYAIYNKKPLLIKYLINKGAVINYLPDQEKYLGCNPPIFYCKTKECLSILIENEVDLTLKSCNGLSLMQHFCYYSDYLELVLLLIENGIEVPTNPEFLFSQVLFSKHKPFLEILITNGMDINGKSKTGKTILDHVETNAFIDHKQELIDLLVSKGAKNGNAEQDIFYAVNANKIELLEQLLKNGVRANQVSKGWNPRSLLYTAAVEQGSLEAVKLLMEYGADKNQDFIELAYESYISAHLKVSEYLLQYCENDKIQATTRIWVGVAIHRKDYEYLKLLLQKGANPNIADEQDYTPLFWAISKNDLKMVQILLDAGVDANSHVLTNEPAIAYAKEHGCTEIVKLLLDTGKIKSTILPLT